MKDRKIGGGSVWGRLFPGIIIGLGLGQGEASGDERRGQKEQGFFYERPGTARYMPVVGMFHDGRDNRRRGRLSIGVSA